MGLLHSQLMTTEDLIAHHVEALIALGWRWEGRGLAPSWGAKPLPNGQHQQLLQEQINHSLRHHYED